LFAIRPLADDGILTESQGAAGTAHGQPVATILVVEDQYVGAFLHSLLTQRNYEVVLASRRAAQAMLRENQARFDVLITNKPLDFTATPDLPLLYLSSSPVPEAIEGFRRALMLSKPFQPGALFERLNELLS
jgi:DNA-binding response OmpR family regulator